MDSFEFNKMAGAVLGSALAVLGLSQLSGMIYHAEKPEKQGFVIEVAEAGTGGENGGGTEQPAAESLGAMLAKADAEKGLKVAKGCLSCHDLTKGGPNKVGPNLWDVVMRPRASHPDYKYTDQMAAKKGEPWSFEAIECLPDQSGSGGSRHQDDVQGGQGGRSRQCPGLSAHPVGCAEGLSGPVTATKLADF